jgi:predicted Zn-dependent protease
MAGALTSVYRRTGDPETRQAAEAVFDGILAVESNPALAMQVAISRIGLDEKTDPEGALQRYRALVDELPAGTIDRLKRFESLSDAERRQVAPIANAAIMAMNNYAAVTATAILDGRVDPANAAPELARALQVSGDLAQIMPENPEILDTRAMVALAAEDGASAVQLAEAAVRQLPQRPGFRFTLAKGLALEGRGEEAVMQAREAIRLLRREPEPDEAQIQTIQRFLEGQRA